MRADECVLKSQNWAFLYTAALCGVGFFFFDVLHATGAVLF